MSNNYTRLMQILNSLRNSSLEMINTNSVIFINAVSSNLNLQIYYFWFRIIQAVKKFSS